MKNLLETLKASFIEELEKQLFLYMTIGSGTNESPMWIQLNPMRDSNDKLAFQNSQSSKIVFTIDVPQEHKLLFYVEYPEAYEYFKYIKYTHIKDNFPTVWEELTEGLNGNRINNFLSSYKLAA
jgi:hypothetical protein